MSADACVYATAGWGVHDQRWVEGLTTVGFDPTVISLGRDVGSDDDLRLEVQAAARGGLPVLAGPLPTVTQPLSGIDVRLVGLSWGYDLADRVPGGADTAWLSGLGGLIVDSEPNRSVALAAGLPPERVTLLPWGVDLATFVFQGPRSADVIPDVPPHAPVVLSLRAHEDMYRVADIVSAFALMSQRPRRTDVGPDPYLVLGHSGSGTDDLRRLADHLGVTDRVRFLGTVPEEDLVPLLARADCYVTASRVDGTSVTLLQAMACGTPVVASDTPGNRGWVEDGVTGFTFPTGDVPALAATLERVLLTRPVDVALRARVLVEQEADWQANLSRLRRAMDQA
jgi:glycosyltransferase involved in cell wall biosynthesis